MGEPIRDGDWLLIDHDPAAQRMVWISEHDGMTVIRRRRSPGVRLQPELHEDRRPQGCGPVSRILQHQSPHKARHPVQFSDRSGVARRRRSNARRP
jgi:hypothetical protein